ncbi:MAG: hypothetical protein MK082_10170 [Phycisphaerales bacterium]|nr:hypothetical protein [Phycisphaerales bacterium]
MATKKQQQQKKKMRDLKKKKKAQNKLVEARNAPASEDQEKNRGGARNQFGGKTMSSQQSGQAGNQMHRPQGG